MTCHRTSGPPQPGVVGLGDPFGFPFQTIENEPGQFEEERPGLPEEREQQ